MGKIVQLQNKKTGENEYPRTYTKAIIDDQATPLDTLMQNQNDKIAELGSEVVTMGVVELKLFQEGNIVANINVGEFAYNNNLKVLVEKTSEEGAYINRKPSENGLYIFKGEYYRWNGTDLVRWDSESVKSIKEKSERLAAPLFNNIPMEEAVKYDRKRLNKDGSISDYSNTDVLVYAVEGGKPYQIKGYTIDSNNYIYAWFSSDDLTASSLINMGYLITGEAVVKYYDFIEIAPVGSTHLAICHYRNAMAGVTNENKVRCYDAIYSSSILKEVDEFKGVNEKLTNIEDDLYLEDEVEISGEKVSSARLSFNGDIITGQSAYAVYRFKVEQGEKYRIFRSGDTGGTNSLTYALYSSDEASSASVVVLGPEHDNPIDAVIEIPQNVVLMVVGQVTTSVNKVTKFERTSKLDIFGKASFAVEVISEEEISITRRYSPSEDVRVTLKKCGPNNLMQLYEHSFIDNTSDIPSFGKAKEIKLSGTDWIGPYTIKADNRDGGYNGVTGGWHGYNGDQTGAKTAETESVEIYVDERTPSAGRYYADRVKVVVTNLMQAGNTKSSDGNGINVLKEIVTYLFEGSRIYVSVCMTALEDISFKIYYGMQVCQYRQSIRYFADKITYKDWGADINRTSNKNLKFIVCKDTNGRYVKAAMDVVGLGMKEYSNIYQYAFVYGDKAYYSLADSEYKQLSLVQGELAYWRGYYEFMPKNSAGDVF